jgi:hypothetical protein
LVQVSTSLPFCKCQEDCLSEITINRKLGPTVLEEQFQTTDDISHPAVTEMVNEAMHTYEYDPTSGQTLARPAEML